VPGGWGKHGSTNVRLERDEVRLIRFGIPKSRRI
jgi:hypothetical protein